MPTSQVGGPQPEFARQGRELQRYGANGERLVAGCGITAGGGGFVVRLLPSMLLCKEGP